MRRYLLMMLALLTAFSVLSAPAIADDDDDDDDGGPVATQTIAEIAAGAGSFNTLVVALDAAGLVDTLNGPGDFVVFAPTDDAFAALEAASPGIIGDLLADPTGALTNVLLYHVTVPEMDDDDDDDDDRELPRGKTEMLNGDILKIRKNKVKVPGTNQKVDIIGGPIAATNGTVFVIDAVLIPPSL